MDAEAIEPPTASRRVAGARIVLVPYLVLLALVVLLPARQASRVTGIVGWIAEALATVGVPREPAAIVLEFLANVALFTPLGALLVLAFPGVRWWAVLLAGFLLSVGIELVQLTIPSRVSTLSDVVANTAGTAVGLLLVRGRRGDRR
ncbi:VanZ family protein [Agromyces mariniharenae]|uniref:VanZ family protein n=1 Tax=Agromyces mariniharenae TaxID=2604423 RepID=UPI001EE5BF58|nr:VanZ family protein [Agromyces mariniharenae]